MKKLLKTIIFSFIFVNFLFTQNAHALILPDNVSGFYNQNYNTEYQSYNIDSIRALLLYLEQNTPQIYNDNYPYYDNDYYNDFSDEVHYHNSNDDVYNYYGNNNNDDEPRAQTDSAQDIEEDSAELRGEIDMNDFNNGIVFFVYGEDEDQIDDIENDYDSYSDVDEDGDDLRKERVDRDLDGNDDYRETIDNLDEDESYYFSICVEYEDDDDDETLECGRTRHFETGDDNSNSNSDDEPEAVTNSATSIDDDSAKLRGEIDMNDFNNGIVFFVYGEDEDQIDDIENDYDSYSDVDEDGDDLRKERVDNDLDTNENYSDTVSGLDDNTDYFFRICVEYEDDDNDETLECGNVRDFETDN